MQPEHCQACCYSQLHIKCMRPLASTRSRQEMQDIQHASPIKLISELSFDGSRLSLAS